MAEIEYPMSKGQDHSNAPKYTMPLGEADGYETEAFCRKEGNRYFWGYLVMMKDVVITDYDESLQYDYD